MPYIPRKSREVYNPLINSIRSQAPTWGELNYIITSLIVHKLKSRTCGYESLQSGLGLLESAKLELYRREVATYEDDRLADNGDVYEPDFDCKCGGCKRMRS